VGSFAYVAAGYKQLADELVRDWGGHAAGVADRIDAGAYDADTLTGDLAQTALLSARTAFLLANEAVEAITVLAKPAERMGVVSSRTYRTPLPGAVVVLQGPLLFEGATGSTALPGRVELVDPGAGRAPGTYFRVSADAAGFPHGPYFGTVSIAAPSGADQFEVSLTVGWGR
jgi:hypothetical protein